MGYLNPELHQLQCSAAPYWQCRAERFLAVSRLGLMWFWSQVFKSEAASGHAQWMPEVTPLSSPGGRADRDQDCCGAGFNSLGSVGRQGVG